MGPELETALTTLAHNANFAVSLWIVFQVITVIVTVGVFVFGVKR